MQTELPTFSLWQRFVGEHPLALLSMHGNFCSLVWSVSNSRFEELMALSDDRFLQALNQALAAPPLDHGSLFRKYLRGSQRLEPPFVVRADQVQALCNKRLSFPLTTSNAARYVEAGLALIGDAAHSIHPMAGQGLNLGLLDANILANVVCKALEAGARLGEESRLSEFELLSKRSNYLMQAGMEALKLSYGFKAAPLAFARNLAVDLLNNSPLKRLAVHAAEGQLFEETRRLYKQSG